MTYGQKIALMRKQKGMTQSELGSKLNVSSQAVSKWEHDLSEPDLLTLKKIAEIFNISIDEFFDHQKNGDNAKSESNFNKEIAPAQKQKEIVYQREMIGVCTKCGNAVYSDNLGQKTPNVICKDCCTAEEEKERRETEESKSTVKKNLTKSFIIGGVIAAVVLLVGLIVVIEWGKSSVSGAKPLTIVLVIIESIALFCFIGNMFLSERMQDAMLWFLTRSIRWPGVVFSLDIGGIIFLITVKVLFAVLGFLFGAAMAILGFILISNVSIVVYPFVLAKTIRYIK